MYQYALRRVLLLVPTLLAVYTITFVLIRATPGGPWDVDAVIPLTPEAVAILRTKFGLDRPPHEQYLTYLGNIIFRWDFGYSFTSRGQSVGDIIADRFPVSLHLGLMAMLLGVLLGIPLGVFSAARQHSWVDSGATMLSVLGVSVPSFVIGPLAVLVFAVGLSQLTGGALGLPTGGWPRNCHWLVLCDRPETMILPTLTLALLPTALFARYTRAAMLEVIHQDYVRTARAKGLSERVTILRHALRNALIPVTTVGGVVLSQIVIGSFFVETVFSVPGLARHVVGSVSNRDYPVLMGVTLLFAVIIAGMNTLVDLCYGLLDPRIKYR
jgi:oligopeptide transport system permease protein